MKSGSKPRHRLDVGDWVRVWRRFDKDPADRWTPDFKKERWVGPCVVLMIKDGSVWVTHKGELWQCSAEQVRPATDWEAKGAELTNEHFEQLREKLSRRNQRVGYKDVSPELPPESERGGATLPERTAALPDLPPRGEGNHGGQNEGTQEAENRTQPWTEEPLPARREEVVIEIG